MDRSSFVEQQFFTGFKKEQAASVSSMGYAGVGRRKDPTMCGDFFMRVENSS
jgi:hypothetical protein